MNQTSLALPDYNRTNTYTHTTARSGPTKHTQMSIGID
jgi:hypothetical protein